MKVWGGLLTNWKRCTERNGQVRTIIAAKNQKTAAQIIGCSLYEFRGYWCETGNETERMMALSRPGTIFQATTSMGKDFEPVSRF